jgi:hypothetical protein
MAFSHLYIDFTSGEIGYQGDLKFNEDGTYEDDSVDPAVIGSTDNLYYGYCGKRLTASLFATNNEGRKQWLIGTKTTHFKRFIMTLKENNASQD